MKDLTLRRMADACGGILHIPEGWERLEAAEAGSIVTDSRKASEGCVFAAIKGERVDGHSFIPQVLSQGALCVLTEHDLEADRCYIRVRSTLQALGGIAREYLSILDIPVVGITGSVGKTSTKEMIASVLAQKFLVHKTKGNFNNELGLPLTVFDLREEHEIAVLEMGISDFGEMHRLSSIACPDTCVITNIGQCHLENLGDRDGVLRAKTEIFDFIKKDGCIILNGDDDKLCQIRHVQGISPVFYGIGNTAGENIYADQIRPLGLTGIAAVIHTQDSYFPVTIPLPGEHMVMNALAATAVGLHYGLTPEEIAAGIQQVQVPGGRFNIVRTDRFTVIDDCYNANPMSMRASLTSLKGAEGGKAAILGDMLELGPEEMDIHAELGRFAASCGLDALIAVGDRCRRLIDAARETDPSLRTAWYPETDGLLAALSSQPPESILRDGDTVLVKASHSMHFDQVVAQLTNMGKDT